MYAAAVATFVSPAYTSATISSLVLTAPSSFVTKLTSNNSATYSSIVVASVILPVVLSSVKSGVNATFVAISLQATT